MSDSSSITSAIAVPVVFKGKSGREYSFSRIGLRIWSEFCEWIKQERRKDIQSLLLDDSAKASLYKEMIYEGVDTDDMLTIASTMRGMVWLVARCCSDTVSSEELTDDINMSEVAGLFRQLADLPSAEGNEVGGEEE